MKKLLMIFFALASSQVFGVSVEFKFDVNSSGPSMYPCNAGIKHAKHDDRICYDRVTSQSCDPSNDCGSDGDEDEGQQCNCVCTGSTSGAGETRLDFLRVSSGAWTENGQTAGAQTAKNLYAPEGAYNMAFNENNKEEWLNQITKMTVDLGSERYGAEYFLDVCYRGPQIEYYFASQNGGFPTSGLGSPNFNLKVHATVNDLTTGMRYSQLSDLKVKAEVVCDQQGKGTYIYAGTSVPSGPTSYDQLVNDITGMTVNGGQYSKTVNFRDFNTVSSSYLIDEFINQNNAFTPRFCKIRYTFLENRRNSNNPLDQIRKWKLQRAEVCTFSEINEDV